MPPVPAGMLLHQNPVLFFYRIPNSINQSTHISANKKINLEKGETYAPDIIPVHGDRYAVPHLPGLTND